MRLRHLLVPLTLLFSVTSRATDLAPLFRPGEIVLFQGDSITDGNRGRSTDPNHILGHGYAFIIAAQAGATFPQDGLVFHNRGISGNKIADLAARWQTDALELRPTVLSILVGINDSLRGTSLPDWEAAYDKLLADTRAALPGVRIVLGEPFTLRVGKVSDTWENWHADVRARREAVGRLAAKHGVPVVPFQRVFDEAAARAPAAHWIWDGIHPTYSGHQLMADVWRDTVRAAWPAP